MSNNMIYIEEQRTFLNLSQVVFAKYVPEHEWVDDETYAEGDPRRIVLDQAQMIITTTALETEITSGFDGEFQGVASKSVLIKLRGESARRMFDWLKRNSWAPPAIKKTNGDGFPF